MPGIFKRFTSVSADKYVFPDAEDLSFPAEAEYEPPALEDLGGETGKARRRIPGNRPVRPSKRSR